MGNMYQWAINSNQFIIEGQPSPLNVKFINEYTTVNPFRESYRNFNFPGFLNFPANPNASLKDVTHLYIYDCYPKDWSSEETVRSKLLNQMYSNIHDGLMIKQWTVGSKVIAYFWTQTDNDGAGRIYYKLPNGALSWTERSYWPCWGFMHSMYISYLLFDGSYIWHQYRPFVNDPLNRPWPDANNKEWIDVTNNAPSAWLNTINPPNPESVFHYPPVPLDMVRYGDLALWRLKHRESMWNSTINNTIVRTIPEYSNNNGTTWIVERPNDILHKAAEMQQIAYLFRSNIGYALYTCNIHSITTVTKKFKFSNTIIKDIVMHGSWPAIRYYDLQGNPLDIITTLAV